MKTFRSGPVILTCLLVLATPLRSQPDPGIAALMNQVSRQNLETSIRTLADANGHKSRVTFTEGNRWAVSYLKQTFESFAGLSSVVLDTFRIADARPPYDSEPLFNVVATLEGREQPEKIYVIGGHLDCSGSRDYITDWESDWQTIKAQGADDNASGLAAILEVARILSDSSNGFVSKFTLKFVAFGAEEYHPVYSDHHYGSMAFAGRASSEGRDILGVYILDMIGFNNTSYLHFDVVSDEASRVLGEKMLEVNSSYRVGLDSNQPPFPRATYSDHDSFWAFGFRSILIIENAPPWRNNLPWYKANPHYHTQEDTYTTINMDQVEKVTQLAVGTLASLAGVVTSVKTAGNETTIHPASFSLYQNFPNPSTGNALIRYYMRSTDKVRLRIYDLLGHEVLTLVEAYQPPGEYSIAWTGRDADGRQVASGVYLYVLEIGDRRLVRKMVFHKP